MKADIWMPLYIGDYMAATQHLSAEKHGIYILLMMHYWKHGPLVDDTEELAIVARVPEDKVQKILDKFFYLDDGAWRHNRIDREKEIANIKSEKARANAKKRWEKEKGGKDDAIAYPDAYAKDDAESMRNRCSSQSPYNSIDKSIETEVSVDAQRVEKEVVKIGDQPLSTDEHDKQLYNQIKLFFEKRQVGERFKNYGKEGKAIKQLIREARARDPDHPDIFLLGMIATFQDLRQTDQFYGKQPFLPSSLNSSGIWDRVLTEAQSKNEQRESYSSGVPEGFAF